MGELLEHILVVSKTALHYKDNAEQNGGKIRERPQEDIQEMIYKSLKHIADQIEERKQRLELQKGEPSPTYYGLSGCGCAGCGSNF